MCMHSLVAGVSFRFFDRLDVPKTTVRKICVLINYTQLL